MSYEMIVCGVCRGAMMPGPKPRICNRCSERENMGNIKITAEAIKALEKPKEIPAIAIGNYKGEPNNRRLFIKINNSIRDPITKHDAITIVIDPKSGLMVNWWTGNGSDDHKFYENVKPL